MSTLRPEPAREPDTTNTTPSAFPTQRTTAAVRDVALAALQAGISVLPIKADGSKAPDLGSWKSYMTEAASEDQVNRWFRKESTGLAFICGEVSGNLELLDFDDTETYERFLEEAEHQGMTELIDRIRAGYEEFSPSGGAHWFYRCEQIAGNQKLAQRHSVGEDGKSVVKTLIETRGEGGYCIVAPSGGSVHRSGRPYVLASGGTESIVTITADEREDLLAFARQFHEIERKPETRAKALEKAGKPGDAFNEEASWQEVLEPHGWKFLFESGGVWHVERPGKRHSGVSGTINHGGHDLLYIFSTACELDAEKGYTKFAAYAELNHGGDYKKAAAALRELGYGDDPHLDDGLLADGYYPTDQGNAERLVAQFGGEVKYCPDHGCWYTWRRTHWARDEDGEMMRRAKQVARKLFQDALECSDSRKRDAMLRHAKASESKSRLEAMVDLASSHEDVVVRNQQLDNDPFLFNCENGTIDLRDSQLRPHNPEDLITRMAAVTYDPTAQSDRWDGFLKTVTDGDVELAEFYARAVGYSLTGSTGEEVLFFVHGPGATGKSTLLEALKALMGPYARTADFEVFLKKPARGISNDVARLDGARLVVSNEVEEGRSMAEALVKQMTGGDAITARYLHKEYFEFQPVFKLWLVANHQPGVSATDDAIWRRIIRLPFEHVIPEDERDASLKAAFKCDPKEQSAILAWAVRGCLEWQKRGLDVPDKVREATNAYRAEMNPLREFVETMCTLGSRQVCTPGEFYEAYKDWCALERETPIGPRKVLEHLRPFAVDTDRGAQGTRFYVGIRPVMVIS